MVTVSNNLMSFVNKPTQVFVVDTSTTKSETSVNKQSSKKEEHTTNGKYKRNNNYVEDTILDNTFSNKFKINIDKTMSIPLKHYPRGLGGAQDFSFFEYLQTGRLPYYIGGPILAALFYSGVSNNNFQSAKAAKNVAKHIAIGVGLYYVGAALAKSIINTTVRLTRGFDLNHPYAKKVPAETNEAGIFKRGTEYHKIPESCEFTRTDLLYNKESNDPKEINKKYIEIAKHYGLKGDSPDIDATVKPLMKKTIVMARAWQYILTACYVTLGIGIANQATWKKESLAGFKRTLIDGVLGKNNLKFKDRMHNLKIITWDYMGKPFIDGCKSFWQGNGSKASSIAGKATILLSALATATAMMLLLGKTTGRFHKIIPQKDRNDEVKK